MAPAPVNGVVDELFHDVGILTSGPPVRELPGTATTRGGLGVAVMI